jgi:hypothetical protein
MLEDVTILTGGEVIAEEMGLKLENAQLSQPLIASPSPAPRCPLETCVRQEQFTFASLETPARYW